MIAPRTAALLLALSLLAVACGGASPSGEAPAISERADRTFSGEPEVARQGDLEIGPVAAKDAGSGRNPEGEFTTVSAGENHTCGVRTDGAVVCWGEEKTILPGR